MMAAREQVGICHKYLQWRLSSFVASGVFTNGSQDPEDWGGHVIMG